MTDSNRLLEWLDNKLGKRKPFWARVLQKIDPVYLSFMSGALVSSAINIYTGELLATPRSKTLLTAIVSAILLLLSSGVAINLSLNLQELKESAAGDAQSHLYFIESRQRFWKLILRLLLLLGTGIGGLIVLSFI